MDTSKPIVTRRSIDDVDAMATAVADGHHAEYVQMERGAFGCRWSVVSTPDVVLQFAHEGIAIARRLRIAENRWAIVVPLSVPDTARWDARPVKRDEMIVCGPKAECYAFDPGGTSFVLISMPAHSATAAVVQDVLHRRRRDQDDASERPRCTHPAASAACDRVSRSNVRASSTARSPWPALTARWPSA